MTKIALKYGVSGLAGVIAVSTTGTSGFSAVFVAALAGFGTALFLALVGRFLYGMSRSDRDALIMSYGRCPRCHAHGTLEVTSNRIGATRDGFALRETDLKCRQCGQSYKLSSSEGGPIVTRI